MPPLTRAQLYEQNGIAAPNSRESANALVHRATLADGRTIHAAWIMLRVVNPDGTKRDYYSSIDMVPSGMWNITDKMLRKGKMRAAIAHTGVKNVNDTVPMRFKDSDGKTWNSGTFFLSGGRFIMAEMVPIEPTGAPEDSVPAMPDAVPEPTEK